MSLFIPNTAVNHTQGARTYMEDYHAVIDTDKFEFFAVYDGHGGKHVAEFCAANLHDYVDSAIREENSVNSALEKSFYNIDGILENATETGCTATVVLIPKNGNVYWVAHCGDSRAIISRSGNCVCLTTDHHPSDDEERRRINDAGGFAFYVCDTCRVNGVLALSRSIGDHGFRPYGVISTPDIIEVPRTNDDEFILIATDGLFSVLSNEESVDLVRKSLKKAKERGVTGVCSTRIAANVLVKSAKSRGLHDNLTVIIINMMNDM